MTLDELESRIERPRRKQHKGCDAFTGRCPSCSAAGRDRTGVHLLVWTGDDGWLHPTCTGGGCSQEEIMGALGLRDEDRRIAPYEDGRPAKPAAVRYTYRDAEKRPLFQKVRDSEWAEANGKPAGWKKTFRQQLMDGTLGLSKLGKKAKLLYNYPEVREAVKSGATIWINEGEKACDALTALGEVATCQPNGAGDGSRFDNRWMPEHTEVLRGAKRVVIVADRDKANDRGIIVGEAYAAYVASHLYDVVETLEVVQSATTSEKDDAWDHLNAGKRLEEFLQRADLLPSIGLTPRTFGESFEAVELTYVVEPYLPRGKCVLFDADGGTGKTTMAVAWAAALSRGLDPITFQPLECGPIKTLYLHKGEDGCDEIETVYRANKGVTGMIAYIDEENAPGLKFDADGLRLIKGTIKQGGYGLVVVDALFYFLEGMVGDGYAAMDVIGVLQAMTRVATQTGATFWNIRHTVKGSIGAQASNLGMGSVQFRNSHRGQLVARRHPEKSGVVVVTDEKGSLLNPRGDHFAYRRIGLEVQYLLNEPNPFEKSPIETRVGKLDAAKSLLVDELTGKWIAAKQIEAIASSRSISKRTIEEARRLLGVQHRTVAEGLTNRTYLHLPSYAEKDPYEDA